MRVAGARRGAGLAAAVLAAALTGCSTPPPTPSPAVTTTVAPPERPVPVVRPAAPPKIVDLRWSFSTGDGSCTATASGPGGALQVQSLSGRAIAVSARFVNTPTVPPRARPVRLRFTGPAGDWTLDGTWQRREFVASLPLDEHGVANVLALLGGGTATVAAGTSPIGTARLPASSGDGSAWVPCPKAMIVRR